MPLASILESNKPLMFATSPPRAAGKPAVLQRTIHKQSFFTHANYDNPSLMQSTPPQDAFVEHARVNYRHDSYSLKRPSTGSNVLNPQRSAATVNLVQSTSHEYRMDEASGLVGDPGDVEAWFEDSLSEGIYDGATDNRRTKKRKELMAHIEKIHTHFMADRERLYANKSMDIEQELALVHSEKHMRFLDGLADLERMRLKMINDGRLFCDYQQQVAESEFRMEIYHAEEIYQTEREEAREKLFAVLEEKRRKLKEDKDNCDLVYDVVLESQSRAHRRNLRKRGTDNSDTKIVKRKPCSDPSMVLRLKEEDIQSDMRAMGNGTTSSPKATKKK